MYSMSQAFNAAFASANRARPIARATVGATTYTTENGNIADMELKETLGDGDGTLPLGETGAAELRLTLAGVSAQGLHGLTVTPSCTLAGRSDWCPLGVFRVESISSPDNYDTIELVCYDAMYYADRTPYESLLTYPTTLQAVYNEVLSQAGLRGSSSNAIVGFEVKSEPVGYSCRQMLGYIAGICGGNARMGRTGLVEIVRYAVVSASDAEINGLAQYDDSGSLDHNTEVQVAGLLVTAGENVWKYSGGSGNAIATYDVSVAQDRSVLANIYELSDGTHQLEITGSGTMLDYGSTSEVPWNSFRTTITELVVADGVTSLGAHSLDGARNLTSVTLSDTVTTIGQYAFYGCTSLTYMSFPVSVATIGDRAFNGCTSLTTLYFAADGLTTIGGSAFRGCTLLGKTNAVVLPNTVQTIGAYAFASCSTLARMQFPSALTSIGEYAFQGCGSLTVVNLSPCAQLTTIGSWAFAYSGVRTFIGGGTAAIGNNAFRFTSLASITLSDTCTGIGSLAFDGCQIDTLDLPESITYIGESALNNTLITALLIPAACTSLGTTAYLPLGELPELRAIAVEAGNPVFSAYDGCLYRGTALVLCPRALLQTDVGVKDGTTDIATQSFKNLNNVQSIRIPSSVTWISRDACNSDCIANITIDKATDSISGSPWGATNATVTWAS